MSALELPQPPTTTTANFGTFASAGAANSCPEIDPSERLKILGWLQACPNPPLVTKEYGIDWTIHRYKECNFVGYVIMEQAKDLNPALSKQLSRPIRRPADEPAQGFDPEFVPKTHFTSLSLGSTPWGYAAPRVLIEQFGRKEPWKVGEERVNKGLEILNETITQSSTPAEFLAVLADKVTHADADPTAVLSHVFAIELKNEGAFFLVKRVANEMKAKAPELWSHYLSLTSEVTKAAGIIFPQPV